MRSTIVVPMRFRLVATVSLLVAPSLLTAQVTRDTPGCARLDIPEGITAINDLLDVPQLSQRLAKAGVGIAPVQALVSVRFDDRGALQHVRVLVGHGDATVDEAVRDALAAAVVRQTPADPWGIRVRLAFGDAPSIQFERAELCPPEPLEEPPAPVIVHSELRQGRVPVRLPLVERPAGPVRLRVLVDEEGRVIRSQLLESSGATDVDETVRSRWERARFRPARLDGVPISSWYEPERQEGLRRTPRGR